MLIKSYSKYILIAQVYKDVGLCIVLHDITKIEESYILPGDGASHTKVTFRFIVFRPWIEEILIGKVRSSSSEGVHGNNLIQLFNSVFHFTHLFLLLLTFTSCYSYLRIL